jgi:hypothetical protein
LTKNEHSLLFITKTVGEFPSSFLSMAVCTSDAGGRFFVQAVPQPSCNERHLSKVLVIHVAHRSSEATDLN